MRRGAELLREQNVLFFDGLLKIALAEAEARAGDPTAPSRPSTKRWRRPTALGYRAFEAELHRAARRNPAEARPRRPRARGRSLPDRHRRRETARHAQLRTARGAVARQALSIDRPPRRSPRRPRAGARRLCADAGNAGDRRGAGAARGARGDRTRSKLRRASAATDAIARRLRQRALRRARLRRAGNDGSLRQSPRIRRRRQGRARAAGGRLRPMGRQLTCEASLPAMRAHAAAFLSDVEARPDSPEAGVAHRVAGITCWFAGEYREARDHLREGARTVPARPRRRSGLPLRTGRRRRRDGLPRDCVCGRSATSIARFRSLIACDERMADLAHVGTLAYG